VLRENDPNRGARLPASARPSAPTHGWHICGTPASRGESLQIAFGAPEIPNVFTHTAGGDYDEGRRRVADNRGDGLFAARLNHIFRCSALTSGTDISSSSAGGTCLDTLPSQLQTRYRKLSGLLVP
jgi:hypothetical protein